MSFQASTYDIYDDGGQILKRVVPERDLVPDIVKTASSLSQQSPGNMFALVMIEGDNVLKKYATADPGNTWLSTLYFTQTKDNLPPEAQKVAAANLLLACEHYDIEPPDVLYDLCGDEAPSTNVVDVTGHKLTEKVASASEDVEYALERSDGSKYFPLNNGSAVKAAADYFERNVQDFVPRERREYAVKVAEVAARVSLPVGPNLQKYASAEYEPSLQGFLTMRYHHLVDMEADPEALKELVKIAKLASEVAPEEFAQQLEEFDRNSGLDHVWDEVVPDPWYTTFGLQKVAKGDPDVPKTFTVGEAVVTQSQLMDLASRGSATLVSHFGDTFAKSFRNNPVTIFQSMPAPQKKLIARLAAEISDESATGA